MTARLPLALIIIVALGTLCQAATPATPATPASPKAPAVKLPAPPAEIVKEAEADNWQYMYSHERSAHTNGADICGRTFLLAVACWTGDATGDYRLLKQTRFNLRGETCLVAAGGYGSQHERIFTADCVLIKNTPRLWKQLTDDEKHKMDLLMKAALVASAYTTSDIGNAKGQNTDLMGGKNLSRGWNPNFQEGMIGMMIVGTAWFDGAGNAYEFLNSYDHRRFCAQLEEAGLTNTYKTFNYAVDHPDSKAPSAAKIERDIKNYTYKGVKLDEPMKIYWMLTTHTYGATVSAGLNDGKGFKGAGKIASGAESLPNVGKKGMLYEFASMDGGGPRSSITYAYTGFRPNLINQVVLIVKGWWQPGKMADECLALLNVGIPDLYYKLEHGYLGYSKGHGSRKAFDINAGWDFKFMHSLWFDVVKPYHEAMSSAAAAK